jgi:hypothetical protein
MNLLSNFTRRVALLPKKIPNRNPFELSNALIEAGFLKQRDAENLAAITAATERLLASLSIEADV